MSQFWQTMQEFSILTPRRKPQGPRGIRIKESASVDAAPPAVFVRALNEQGTDRIPVMDAADGLTQEGSHRQDLDFIQGRGVRGQGKCR